MTNTIQTYRIQRERTSITVPHQGGNLTLAYPYFKFSTYQDLQCRIERKGLSTPSIAELVSFVHQAYLHNEPEFNEIRNRGIWAFTGNLWVPNKGVYIQDHPGMIDRHELLGGRIYMEESDLIRKLESSNDPSVRFVPFGFKSGEMTPKEFKDNAFVKAAIGEEGAEKFAEFTSKTGRKPQLRLPSDPETIITSLMGFSANSGSTVLICYFAHSASEPLGGVNYSYGVAKLSAPAGLDTSEASVIVISSSEIEDLVRISVRKKDVIRFQDKLFVALPPDIVQRYVEE